MLVNLMRKEYREHMKEKETNRKDYKPDPGSFEAFIEYTFANPGNSLTYKEFKKFKKEKENK